VDLSRGCVVLVVFLTGCQGASTAGARSAPGTGQVAAGFDGCQLVNAVAHAPDGSYLAVAHSDEAGQQGGVTLWSSEGELLRGLQDSAAAAGDELTGCFALAFSADGQQVAADCLRTASWEASSGRLIWARDASEVRGSLINGPSVVLANSGKTILWHPDASHQLSSGELWLHPGAASPDGKHALLWTPKGGDSGDYKLWDLATRKARWSLPVQKVERIRSWWQGEHVVVAHEAKLLWVELASGKIGIEHELPEQVVPMAPVGETAVVGYDCPRCEGPGCYPEGNCGRQSPVRIGRYDLEGKSWAWILELPEATRHSLSPSEKALVVSSERGCMHLIDTSSGKKLAQWSTCATRECP